MTHHRFVPTTLPRLVVAVVGVVLLVAPMSLTTAKPEGTRYGG